MKHTKLKIICILYSKTGFEIPNVGIIAQTRRAQAPSASQARCDR